MREIKIYSESQVVLLRSVNKLLGKYRLPREILGCVDSLMEMEDFGEQSFILIILSPVQDDVRDIVDAINLYPLSVEFANDLIRQDIRDSHCKSAKDRDWFLNKIRVKETGCEIFVLYSILRKHLYKFD